MRTGIAAFTYSILTALGLVGAVGATLTPEWMTRVAIGNALAAGPQGLVVRADGVSFQTGTTGSSSNTDVTTQAFDTDGALLWSHSFDGPAAWHDQARGIALGADGHVYVTGNTPGPGNYANLLVLEYDAETGALLDSIQLAAGQWTSEHGASIAADAEGNVFVGGGTVGDGGDAMIVSFDADGDLRWRETWDGPADSPYSGDTVVEVLLAPDGDLVTLIHGVMGSLHPDYVVRKYARADGALRWHSTWGVTGGDSPRDLELDAQGDVYVTGTGIDFVDKYSTIKLRGSDGALLWQGYDTFDHHNSPSALALDGSGGVYVTGSVDPDGDRSNSNDNFFTVKRDAATGDHLWSHHYGAGCLYCLDVPADVVADPSGHVFVAGTTSSPPYSGDGILLVLDAATGVELDRGVVAGGSASEVVSSGILAFDADFDLYDGGRTTDYDTGQIEMGVTKWLSLVDPILRDGFDDGSTTAWSWVVP